MVPNGNLNPSPKLPEAFLTKEEWPTINQIRNKNLGNFKEDKWEPNLLKRCKG